jgi:hypothetical protein
MKQSSWLRAIASLVLALACSAAFAGSVSGPYLIWFNLADDHDADTAIHDFTHAFDDDFMGHFQGTPLEGCWNPDALLLIAQYPPAITPTLVRAAVVRSDPAAGRRLRQLMLKGDDDIKGYDGVIVIVHSPKPTVMSFPARGRIKARVAVDKSGNADWPAAFCDVLPPISRKP